MQQKTWENDLGAAMGKKGGGEKYLSIQTPDTDRVYSLFREVQTRHISVHSSEINISVKLDLQHWYM